jgi:adenylate cyclase
MKILIALQVKLTEGEQVRLWAKKDQPHSLEAYEKVLLGREYNRRHNMDDHKTARQLFEEAIRLDPQYAYAYAQLAWNYVHEIFFGQPKNPRKLLEKAAQLVKEALALNDSLDFVYAVLGVIYLHQRQFDKAVAAGERALALNPNGADVQVWLAMVKNGVSQAEEAFQLCQKAIRLNPIPPVFYYIQLGQALILTKRYDEAIIELKKALQVNPNNFFINAFLTIAYALSGRQGEASTAYAEVLRIHPKYSLEYVAKNWPHKNQADLNLIIDALRKVVRE